MWISTPMKRYHRKYFSGGVVAAATWDGAMGVLHRHKGDRLAAMATAGDLGQLSGSVDIATRISRSKKSCHEENCQRGDDDHSPKYS